MKRGAILKIAIILGLLGITFLVSLFISHHFYDLSYDGQASHQEAVFQLSNGWIPFYKQLDKFEANNLHRWLNHYAKSVWIYETIVFKATHDIESAKLFHIWLILATFCFTFSFLAKFKKLPPYVICSLSLLVALNPVSVYQSLSFYLDGQMMSLTVMMILTLGYIYGEDKGIHYWILFFIIPILVNAKLTAGAYTAIILAGFLVMLWLKRDISKLYKVFIVATVASIIGFLLIGMSPYITNTIYKGNPLYPVFGPDHEELYKTMNMPGNFQDKNSAVLLFYSIFSKSDNVRFRESRAELKIPFTIRKDEGNAFTDTNAKEGGFGPLFGGAIILSLMVIGGALIRLTGRKGYHQIKCQSSNNREPIENIRNGIFCLTILLITCLINPVSSLARFIPQMWLFPIISVLLAYSFNNKMAKVTGNLIMLVLAANIVFIAVSYYGYNLKFTNLYNRTFEEMAIVSKKDPLKVYFGHFKSSNMLRFDKYGIDYKVIENKEECQNGQNIFPNSILLKCP